MNHSDVAHRFCNQDFGKQGHLTSGNVSVSGRNYYSYSTVFGQWVDLKKKVCIVYWGGTSSSSSKHKLHSFEFPSDVHVFPYNDHFRANYGGWHGCKLVNWLGDDSDFTLSYRLILIDYYVDCMYNRFHAIVNGKSKGLENISFDDWEYVNKLCNLYKDASVNVWLKKRIGKEWGKKKCMVKLLRKGERDVEKITDAMFGEGTFKRYYDYCERYRKANDSKISAIRLAHYLGYCSPYGRDWEFDGFECPYTTKQLRSLTAKERIGIKFKNIQKKEELSKVKERNAEYLKVKRNAYKYIVGEEPTTESEWSNRYDNVANCFNRFDNESYCLKQDKEFKYNYASWCDNRISFNFDDYRHSDDKEQWMREFYANCKRIELNIKAQNILMRINAHGTGKFSWTKRYVDDGYLKEYTTPEEYEICKKFIELQEKHFADEEARERAEALRRQREEEERKREKELQEKIKAEQIEQCIAEGDEGYRNLWRLHYMSINDAKSRCQLNDKEFFNGGNVLMRFSMSKDIVETSMHIRLDIPTCKKFFKLINIWHEHPEKFRECQINTHYSGTYTIRSFKNDILTAGCHNIAYAEMKRMYDEILTLEKAV